MSLMALCIHLYFDIKFMFLCIHTFTKALIQVLSLESQLPSLIALSINYHLFSFVMFDIKKWLFVFCFTLKSEELKNSLDEKNPVLYLFFILLWKLMISKTHFIGDFPKKDLIFLPLSEELKNSVDEKKNPMFYICLLFYFENWQFQKLTHYFFSFLMFYN